MRGSLVARAIAIGALLLVTAGAGTPGHAVTAVTVSVQEAVTAPLGFAIDSRETRDWRADLLLSQADQFTPENDMKPDGWYGWDRAFRMGAGTRTLVQFAVDHDLSIHGHTLVWHQQVPTWFFEDDSGVPLTADAAGREVLSERLHAHIFGVAQALSEEFGEFGAGNPVVSFDVVNEVIADSGEFADGLRRSEWYRILGEDFIDLAFTYAEQAFNQEHAAPGSERPVTLMINDYGTEWPGKAQRLHALVERLLIRGVPVDGVGHQFHVNLGMPVERLDDALDAFEDLAVAQAVTEFDVPAGLPVTQEALERQASYYAEAFTRFEKRAPALAAVTVWGLTDDRSWRNSGEGAPVLFDASGNPKPAAFAIHALAPEPEPEPVPTFTDIASNPFRAEIEWLAGERITTGWPTEPGFAAFRPLQNLNRDQAAAFLYRFAGAPAFTPPAQQTFTDVPVEHVFFTEIEWLAASGITNGWLTTHGTQFRPATAVNRDMMAAFLYRFAGEPEVIGASSFRDVPGTHVFAREIAWLESTGITTGWSVPGGAEFRPTLPVKRDQMAAFLYRLHGSPV